MKDALHPTSNFHTSERVFPQKVLCVFAARNGETESRKWRQKFNMIFYVQGFYAKTELRHNGNQKRYFETSLKDFSKIIVR